MNDWPLQPFNTVHAERLRNGITRPKATRGSGYKMVNMGELFAYDRLWNPEMDLVLLSDSEIERFSLKQGDLLFARQSLVLEGTGKCSIVMDVPEITCFESHLIRVRLDKQRVDPLFYYYYFGSHQGKANIQSLVMQVAAAGIRGSELALLRVPVPPLPTQRKISAILSAYDDLIENNLRRIKILEEMAQNLYREWFVKFRFPGHEHARLVDSPLGWIPEGWEGVSFSDVAIVHRGRSYKGVELADKGGHTLINLKCIERGGGFRSSGLKRYTGRFKDTQTVRAGEMVMAITDMTQERRIIARVGRVSRLDSDFGVISMDLVRIASRGSLSETYLYAMLRWSGFADEVKQYANGANVLHLLPDRIKEYRFICPPPDIAARFGEIVLPMLLVRDSFEQRNTTLRRTRDLLLPRLISGEVDVSELDIATPEEA